MMCIQDNLRYIGLVKLGMLDTVQFVYNYCGGELCEVIAPRLNISNMSYVCISDKTPEKAFDRVFSLLEKVYATIS